MMLVKGNEKHKAGVERKARDPVAWLGRVGAVAYRQTLARVDPNADLDRTAFYSDLVCR